MRIALIAPPWPIFNRPSIQVAALAAYIRKRLPQVECRCFYPYLSLYEKIGAQLYGIISDSSWASEAIGAMLLTPGYEDQQAELAIRMIKDGDAKKRLNKDTILEVRDSLRSVLGEFLGSLDWSGYDFVGITVSLNQLCSGLYLAKEIKRLSPSTKIVMGGASVSGTAGEAILNTFPFIDFVVSGEGEGALYSLIHSYLEAKPIDETFIRAEELKDMDSLPPPDFSDFFEELQRLPPEKRFIPVLPIEFSRGCFWGRCTFCNLNLQWKGYRSKSSNRMAREVLWLSRRYGVLDFAFMDNALPPKEMSEFFREIRERGVDLEFFGELRASISRELAQELGASGLKTVQVGIESLSPTLLRRLRKGRSVMDNMATMRHLLEAGISLEGNLILDFPGSSEKEVEETMEALRFARYFKPLRAVSFWLGLGSPVFSRPDEFQIRYMRPHRNYKTLFPEDSPRETMVYEYGGTLKRDRALWKRVRRKIGEWHRYWNEHARHIPPLTYRDGGDFVLIRQVLDKGTVLQHRLQGLSRKIFLEMLEPIEIKAIMERNPGVSSESLHSFLEDLHVKGLIFKEGVKVLALPVRNRKI